MRDRMLSDRRYDWRDKYEVVPAVSNGQWAVSSECGQDMATQHTGTGTSIDRYSDGRCNLWYQTSSRRMPTTVALQQLFIYSTNTACDRDTQIAGLQWHGTLQ